MAVCCLSWMLFCGFIQRVSLSTSVAIAPSAMWDVAVFVYERWMCVSSVIWTPPNSNFIFLANANAELV